MPSELNQKKASICRDPPGNVSLGLYVEVGHASYKNKSLFC